MGGVPARLGRRYEVGTQIGAFGWQPDRMAADRTQEPEWPTIATSLSGAKRVGRRSARLKPRQYGCPKGKEARRRWKEELGLRKEKKKVLRRFLKRDERFARQDIGFPRQSSIHDESLRGADGTASEIDRLS